MEVIKLDFTGCKHFKDLHKRMKKTFDFPDYYGENADALWDCITDALIYSGSEDRKILVEVYGTKNLPKGCQSEMDLTFIVFNRVHEHCSDVEFKIMS